jgi:hypothetical protein
MLYFLIKFPVMGIAIDQPASTDVHLDNERRSCGRASHVCFWHLTDKPAAPEFVAYWTNNGQRVAVR